MREPLIGVVGDRRLPPNDPRRALATELGSELVQNGYSIATGGLGDLASSVAVGARSSDRYRKGCLVAILPGFDPKPAVDHADVIIATGMDHARNMVVANSDAVVAIGGGAGTLSEMAFAWLLFRLVIAYRVQGWSGSLAGKRIDERLRYPEIPEDQVYGVDNAGEVVSLLARYLPLYQRRHSRLPPD